MNKPTVTRILMVVLFAQALTNLVLLGNVSFAAVLVLVAVKLRSDRSWLLVPMIVNGLGFLFVLTETLAMPPGQGPPLLRPLLTVGLFLAVYLVGYGRLGDPSSYEGPSRGNKGFGWRFDKWAGGDPRRV